MSLKNAYKIIAVKQEDNLVYANVFINKTHAIFKGHFPNNPVVPGVLILQIVKELTAKVVGKKLRMVAANNVKFKAVINPEIHPALQFQLTLKMDGAFIKVKNVTTFEDILADLNEAGNPIVKTTTALQLSATYSRRD